jgi:glutamate--cysteine ligase catalytic subunit
VIKYVREHGIQQFIKLYNRVKNIEGDSLLWGDEVEYAIFQLDPEAGTVKLSLRGSEMLKMLQDKEVHSKPLGQHCNWVPEWGNWMLEGTPARPYSGYAADLVQVERNMRIRRARILATLKPNEICPTLPCFPMMGVGDFTVPSYTPKLGLSDSLFIPDEITNPAPRFAALVANIKKRRGSKVDIRVPRFQDVRTRKPLRPKGCPAPATVQEADEMEEVYMDAMAFGMGCCCLQVKALA